MQHTVQQKTAAMKTRRLKKTTSFQRVASVVDVTARKLERLGSFVSNRPKPSRWGVLGVRRNFVDDFQGKMYEMDWDFLVVFCLALYFIVSVIFAALFYVTGAVYEEMLPSAHLSLPEACFWLSVTNLTTIGYGSISPETRLAYVLCTVEHFAGIMMSSLLLGIVFAKASMPTTKTAFSRVCLITARNGVPHLLIRIGNTRGNFLLHPEIRVSYFHRLVTKEGEVTFKGRRCEVTDPTAVAPSLIIAHEIDEASPLHNLTSEDIAAAEGAIFVSVSATDDNSKQSVIARTIFRSSDILWNRRFQDVLVQKDWRQFVDFTRFHDTVPITEQPLAGDAVDLPIAPHDPRLEQNLVQHADIMGRSGDMVRAQAEATLLQRRRDNEESSSAADAQPDTFHESTGAADNQQLRRRGSHLTSIPEETEKQGLQKGYS